MKNAKPGTTPPPDDMSHILKNNQVINSYYNSLPKYVQEKIDQRRAEMQSADQTQTPDR